MKTKLLLCVAIVALCVACNSNNPYDPSKIHTGSVIGTLGCYNENRDTFYEGYFIETEAKDTFLTFHLAAMDLIPVSYGTHVIQPIPIPYSFHVEVLKENDERYTHYSAWIIEDAAHQPFPKPYNEIEQIILTPAN